MTSASMGSGENLATDYSLPQVSKETLASLLADAREQGVDDLMNLARERMATNNPDLCEILGRYSIGRLGEDVSPEVIAAMRSLVVMTHELLRRQGEAEAFKAMLDLSQSENESW